MIFSSPVATAEFSRFAGILSAALSQHHLLGFEITAGIPECLADMWVGSGWHGIRGAECNRPHISPFEGGCHYCMASTIVSPQAKLQRGNTTPSINKKNQIKDLLSMALTIRARLRFLLSQSLPSGSFHKSFILIHQRADRMETTVTENSLI